MADQQKKVVFIGDSNSSKKRNLEKSIADLFEENEQEVAYLNSKRRALLLEFIKYFNHSTDRLPIELKRQIAEISSLITFLDPDRVGRGTSFFKDTMASITNDLNRLLKERHKLVIPIDQSSVSKYFAKIDVYEPNQKYFEYLWDEYFNGTLGSIHSS